MKPENPYKVFHSTCELLREHIHLVLVRPEYGGNVGSIARAAANMGIRGSLRIVGSPRIVDGDARRMAKHAGSRLDQALHFETLRQALDFGETPRLSLAATARVGSSNRPHPLRAGVAVERALRKLASEEVKEICLVFGPESDGLRNDEVDLCDWVATIASSEEYRSLNLAQAVMIFAYEANRQLTEDWPRFRAQGKSQRERLIAHFVRLAEEVGFILPGDPYKMRPRLEDLLSQLPPSLPEVKTLHGLLDQAIRSARAGGPELKGRYRHYVEARSEGTETQ